MIRSKPGTESRDGLPANIRDKTHMEFVDRWAEHVKSVPRERWKAEQTAFINSVFEKANAFYKRLEKTEKGRKILKRLMNEKMRR
jgi:hypothetical protein